MNKQQILSEIKQSYIIKRIKAEEKTEKFIAKLKKDAKFNDIYTEFTKKNIEYLKSQVEKENLDLKKDVEYLQSQIDKYFSINKIDKNKLNTQYECSICNDTGLHNGKTCECIIREYNTRLSKNLSTQSEFKNFNSANEDIMTEQDKKALSVLKLWCENYPSISKFNINIMGGAGSGKTFLIECVANELINRHKTVCYLTSFIFNETCKAYHFGQTNNFYDLLNAEILIIDDLGTESIFKNITNEYLYNVINQRQVDRKPTFITSNLSLDNLRDRYDERIFSRLVNKNLSLNIQLENNDKRIK